ncbi:MAG: gliding motility lipoprotein GldB [Cyclobacteriaceae bacterium]|nr:gliding motility lipoprotein GldB [Cyclobacteriaceae bacterium]
MRKLFILFISSYFLFSCNNNTNTCQNRPNVNEDIVIEVSQLHHELLTIESEKELYKFIEREPVIASFFLKKDDYPNDSIMSSVLYKRFSNPHIDTLRQEIDRVFGDNAELIQNFKSALAMLKYYYPEANLPKIKLVATGLENGADLFVSDSLIIVGLDFYLGEGAKYRPLGFPNYLLQKYTKEYIVPSVMLLYGISSQYNASDIKDKSMLADMITYGKSYYFAKMMMPCTPDSTIIGYTSEEIEGSEKNATTIWAHFLDNELLYEQDNFLKQKYLGERPKTFEIGDKCPGRIGTWLGWEIVNEFVDKKELTLQELMKKENAQQLFQMAKYRPEK